MRPISPFHEPWARSHARNNFTMLFPLTPALSLGEREKPSRLCHYLVAVHSPNARPKNVGAPHEPSKHSTPCSPFHEPGENSNACSPHPLPSPQGEGERFARAKCSGVQGFKERKFLSGNLTPVLSPGERKRHGNSQFEKRGCCGQECPRAAEKRESRCCRFRLEGGLAREWTRRRGHG